MRRSGVMVTRVLMIGAGAPPPTFIARAIESLSQQGVEVRLLPEPVSRNRLEAKLIARGVVASLQRRAREAVEWAQVLHYQWPGHHAYLWALAARHGKPSLLSVRGRQINVLPHLPGQQRALRQLRRSFAMVDGVHGVSQHILDSARELGLRARRQWVVRPAIDIGFFAPASHTSPPTTPAPLRLAMVGALMWRKGYDHALLALARLLRAGVDARLEIAGDGEERDRVERTVADLGLRERVTLLGRQRPAQIAALLARSQVYMLTSMSEGIANSALEAMACGLPVVCTDAGGMTEAVRDGVDGYVVAPRDVEALADRVARLARDPSAAQAMGRSARARVEARFDLRDQARQFAAIYRELAR